MIASLQADAAPGGRTWLGDPTQDFGVRASDRQGPPTEHFLEFVGWEPPVADPSQEVTPSSDNSHAALQPPEYVTPLKDILLWYWVEYLDNQDLQQFTAIPNITDGRGPDLSKAVAKNKKAPQVLIYHLFYALHQETLEGCEKAGQGSLFGTYAGEWHCIALLLDSSGAPQFIGLTSRNVGGLRGVDEPRVGMGIFNFADVQLEQGHPKIFVSLNTHGHYLTSGPHVVNPFTPGGIDPSRMSCGQVEFLDGAVADNVITGLTDVGPSTAVMLTKIFGGLAEGPIGFFLGMDWYFNEVADAGLPLLNFQGPTPPNDDINPGQENLGGIVKPSSVVITPAQGTKGPAFITDWNVIPSTPLDEFIVDRSQQVWWGPRPTPADVSSDPAALTPAGFTGRWGPRVTSDPNTRRAGMKCPDFLLMFLEGVAVKLNV